MPENSRWDLIRVLKVNLNGIYASKYVYVALGNAAGQDTGRQ